MVSTTCRPKKTPPSGGVVQLCSLEINVIAEPGPSPVDVRQLGQEISHIDDLDYAFKHLHRTSYKEVPGPLRLPDCATVSLISPERVLTLSANQGVHRPSQFPAHVVQTCGREAPRQQAARCCTSYQKNGDRKKHFYEIVKFIFPNDEGALTPIAVAAKCRQLADKPSIFALNRTNFALANTMFACGLAATFYSIIIFDACAGRRAAIAQQFHCIYYRPC